MPRYWQIKEDDGSYSIWDTMTEQKVECRLTKGQAHQCFRINNRKATLAAVKELKKQGKWKE